MALIRCPYCSSPFSDRTLSSRRDFRKHLKSHPKRFRDSQDSIKEFARANTSDVSRSPWVVVSEGGFYGGVEDRYEVKVFGGLTRKQTGRLAAFLKQMFPRLRWGRE